MPGLLTSRKIAEGLRVDIPKAVQEVTDMKSIDFSRGHHHVSDPEKRNYCKTCKILRFRPGELPGGHQDININAKGQ
jgi:hypothetical protein